MQLQIYTQVIGQRVQDISAKTMVIELSFEKLKKKRVMIDFFYTNSTSLRISKGRCKLDVCVLKITASIKNSKRSIQMK